MLEAVYWSVMHGWLFCFMYGDDIGRATAAAEWYVQRQLIPWCQDEIGVLFPTGSISVECIARIDFDECSSSAAEQVGGSSSANAQSGGSSLSPQGGPSAMLTLENLQSHAEIVLQGVEGIVERRREASEECAQSSREACDAEVLDGDGDLQHALWLSNVQEMPKTRVHFVNSWGEVVFSMVVPNYATAGYLEYMLNKNAFQYLFMGEHWLLACAGYTRETLSSKAVLVMRGDWRWIHIQLPDFVCRRTHDGQVFMDIVKVWRNSFDFSDHWRGMSFEAR